LISYGKYACAEATSTTTATITATTAAATAYNQILNVTASCDYKIITG
jgi:hypothetical protein